MKAKRDRLERVFLKCFECPRLRVSRNGSWCPKPKKSCLKRWERVAKPDEIERMGPADRFMVWGEMMMCMGVKELKLADKIANRRARC